MVKREVTKYFEKLNNGSCELEEILDYGYTKFPVLKILEGTEIKLYKSGQKNIIYNKHTTKWYYER